MELRPTRQIDELSDAERTDIARLLDDRGVTTNRSLLAEIVATGLNLAGDGGDELDLKIISAALAEMREAFAMFRPYRHLPKVTVFGSARVAAHDALYAQAQQAASQLADDGWMVITGAGPGLMQAATEGAGVDRSIGVTIRLPWESGANSVIAGDSKLVSMKYFFTRKLMLIKESNAFVCLPGGFGTLDETFELLTLTQTGKGAPVPIVFLDTPGSTYWSNWAQVIRDELVGRGFINADDLDLFLVTDDVSTAVDEICRFTSNFDSLRWVGDRLILRVKRLPDSAQLELLNTEFAHLCVRGVIEPTGPTRAERSDADKLDLPRLALVLDPRKAAGLRQLIDRLNALD
ncbi:MAG: TIGR00730 family Rossman fold protein [Acidimicrobiia bacterium]